MPETQEKQESKPEVGQGPQGTGSNWPGKKKAWDQSKSSAAPAQPEAPAEPYVVPTERFIVGSNLPLTEEEKEKGITADQKRDGYKTSDISDYDKAYYAHSGFFPEEHPHTAARKQARANRDAELETQPHLSTKVDNNQLKVHVFVNKTGHLVPPGPMSVGRFKQIIGQTGAEFLEMNKRPMLDDNEQIELFDGERFATNGQAAI